MRKKIVAGNWKMNNDLAQTDLLLTELMQRMPSTDAEVMVAPTFVNLRYAYELTRKSNIEVMAQNMHFADSGAFTGEISAEMLKTVGVNTVILGHSERRSIFGEDDALLTKKVDTALAKGMKAMFCFGEELADRKAGSYFSVVETQLSNVLFHLKEKDWQQVILAYEPVWAIGTGETATPEQAQEMHAFIRKTIAEKYNETIAGNVSILYGGSVKPANAKEIFAQPDVDGGLVGGASLKADDFAAIIAAI